MFCTSCGREIIDTARFCNYCGRPVQNIAPPPTYPSQTMGQQGFVSTPDPNMVIQTETSNSTMYSTFNSFSNNFSTASSEPPAAAASETEIPPQQDAANETFSAAADPYPTPNSIPQSGFGVSGAYSMPTDGTQAAAPAASAPSTPKRERKYTLGHIMLCLAAVAIMAITAGIFAGLYFSVV